MASLPITTLCLRPEHNLIQKQGNIRTRVAAHNMAATRGQQEIEYPLNVVGRADGMFEGMEAEANGVVASMLYPRQCLALWIFSTIP